MQPVPSHLREFAEPGTTTAARAGLPVPRRRLVHGWPRLRHSNRNAALHWVACRAAEGGDSTVFYTLHERRWGPDSGRWRPPAPSTQLSAGAR